MNYERGTFRGMIAAGATLAAVAEAHGLSRQRVSQLVGRVGVLRPVLSPDQIIDATPAAAARRLGISTHAVRPWGTGASDGTMTVQCWRILREGVLLRRLVNARLVKDVRATRRRDQLGKLWLAVADGRIGCVTECGPFLGLSPAGLLRYWTGRNAPGKYAHAANRLCTILGLQKWHRRAVRHAA